MAKNKTMTLEEKLEQYANKVAVYVGLCEENDGEVEQEMQEAIDAIKTLIVNLKEKASKKKDDFVLQRRILKVNKNAQTLREKIKKVKEQNRLKEFSEKLHQNISILAEQYTKIETSIDVEKNPAHQPYKAELERHKSALKQLKVELLEDEKKETQLHNIEQDKLTDEETKIGTLKAIIQQHISDNTLLDNKEELIKDITALVKALKTITAEHERNSHPLLRDYQRLVKKAEQLLTDLENTTAASYPKEFETAFDTTKGLLEDLAEDIKQAAENNQNDTTALAEQLETIKTQQLTELSKMVGTYEGEMYTITDKKVGELEQLQATLSEQLNNFSQEEQQLDSNMQQLLDKFNGDPLQLLEHLKTRWDNLQTAFSTLKSNF